MGFFRRVPILRTIIERVRKRERARQLLHRLQEHDRQLERVISSGNISNEEMELQRGRMLEDVKDSLEFIDHKELLTRSFQARDQAQQEWASRQPTINVAISDWKSGEAGGAGLDHLIIGVRPKFGGGHLQHSASGKAGFSDSIDGFLGLGGSAPLDARSSLRIDIRRSSERWERSSLHVYEYETEQFPERIGSGQTALIAKLTLSAALHDHLVDVVRPYVPEPETYGFPLGFLFVLATRCQPFAFPAQRNVERDQPIPNAFNKRLHIAPLTLLAAVEEDRLKETGSTGELGPAFVSERPDYGDPCRYVEIGRWKVTESAAEDASEP